MPKNLVCSLFKLSPSVLLFLMEVAILTLCRDGFPGLASMELHPGVATYTVPQGSITDGTATIVEPQCSVVFFTF